MREHERRGCVAGNHHKVGPVGGNQIAHQGNESGDQCRFVVAAIRKESVVGHVHIAGVGPRLDDLAEHREPAKPGIEDENGGGDAWH